VAGKDSIYMASDSRMNYFEDKEIDGKRYQEIKAVADGIQKTFFIGNLGIGIQFLGIGFFPEGDKKHPISYFIKKLASKKKSLVEEDFKFIFDFFKRLSVKEDTGQYVKGIMSAFENGCKKICLFNTFNNDFRIKELQAGEYIDSENITGGFSRDKESIVEEIKKRINTKSEEKWESIGGNITLLEIKKGSFNFILDFEEDFNKIKWKDVNPPMLKKYD
jgi:hypothetical protein